MSESVSVVAQMHNRNARVRRVQQLIENLRWRDRVALRMRPSFFAWITTTDKSNLLSLPSLLCHRGTTSGNIGWNE